MDPILYAERILLASLRRVQEMSRRSRLSDGRRIADSHAFWNDPARSDLETIMHWRGEGPFRDDRLWLELGRKHLSMLKQAAEWADIPLPVERIVEWGCGGGMNAVQLARETSVYIGVDVNPRSLKECVHQVTAERAGRCVPVLIDSANPEAAVEEIGALCDLLFSSYVFEVFPSTEYGLRVLRVAYELLRPGGVALIQVRYHSGVRLVSGDRLAYARNWLSNTSFTIEGFWTASEEVGFEPLYVTLVPRQPELDESRYAYFALKR